LNNVRKNSATNDNFRTLFNKFIKTSFKRGFDNTSLQRTACLVVNPLNSWLLLFSCTLTGRRSPSQTGNGRGNVGSLYFVVADVPST